MTNEHAAEVLKELLHNWGRLEPPAHILPQATEAIMKAIKELEK